MKPTKNLSRLLKNMLIALSTAKFEPFKEASVTKSSDNEYTIHSYVDSQNSFGAMIRSHYSITLQDSANTWIIKDFMFGGEYIKNSRAEKIKKSMKSL
jgi:hypothetical protein